MGPWENVPEPVRAALAALAAAAEEGARAHRAAAAQLDDLDAVTARRLDAAERRADAATAAVAQLREELEALQRCVAMFREARRLAALRARRRPLPSRTPGSHSRHAPPSLTPLRPPLRSLAPAAP